MTSNRRKVNAECVLTRTVNHAQALGYVVIAPDSCPKGACWCCSWQHDGKREERGRTAEDGKVRKYSESN